MISSSTQNGQRTGLTAHLPHLCPKPASEGFRWGQETKGHSESLSASGTAKGTKIQRQSADRCHIIERKKLQWNLSDPSCSLAGSCVCAPLTKSQSSSSQMLPQLTDFCRACMPALDVAPEKGGIHERLVTQMALHRGEAVGRAELDPPESTDFPALKICPHGARGLLQK